MDNCGAAEMILDTGPDPEWYRELAADLDAPVPLWPSPVCHRVTADFEATLDCPHPFSWREGTGWVHA